MGLLILSSGLLCTGLVGKCGPLKRMLFKLTFGMAPRLVGSAGETAFGRTGGTSELSVSCEVKTLTQLKEGRQFHDMVGMPLGPIAQVIRLVDDRQSINICEDSTYPSRTRSLPNTQKTSKRF